jgi:hypothetical protein
VEFPPSTAQGYSSQSREQKKLNANIDVFDGMFFALQNVRTVNGKALQTHTAYTSQSTSSDQEGG